tara:strand:+ start:287 stop:586 length:300 start_codon:yes stop_codon:yes gene_type:complete
MTGTTDREHEEHEEHEGSTIPPAEPKLSSKYLELKNQGVFGGLFDAFSPEEVQILDYRGSELVESLEKLKGLFKEALSDPEKRDELNNRLAKTMGSPSK